MYSLLLCMSRYYLHLPRDQHSKCTRYYINMPIKELRDLLLGIAVPSILSSFRSKSDLCSTKRLISNQAMSDSQKPLLANLLPVCSKGMKCFYFRLSYNVPFQVTGIATYSLRFCAFFSFFSQIPMLPVLTIQQLPCLYDCATITSAESKLSLKKNISESQTLGIKAFAYHCGVVDFG